MAVGDSVTAEAGDFGDTSRFTLTLLQVPSGGLFPPFEFRVENEAIIGDGVSRRIDVAVGQPDGENRDLDLGTIAPGEEETAELVVAGIDTSRPIGVAFSADNDFVPDFLTREDLDWVTSEPGIEVSPPDDEPEEAPVPDLPEDTGRGREYSLPFSVLNAAPWVTGVEDFDITIPQVEQIRDIVEQERLSEDEVFNNTFDALESFNFPEPPSVDDIADAVDDRLDLPDVPSLGDIRGEVDDALADLDLPDPPGLDEIVDGVTDTIADLIDDVEQTVADVERAIDQTVASAEREIQETVREVETTVDETFADLDDALSGVEDTVDDTLETADDILSRLDELPDEVAEAAVDAVQPEINGVGLFDDPVGFAVEAVAEAIDRSVSEETAERLSERASQ